MGVGSTIYRTALAATLAATYSMDVHVGGGTFTGHAKPTSGWQKVASLFGAKAKVNGTYNADKLEVIVDAPGKRNDKQIIMRSTDFTKTILPLEQQHLIADIAYNEKDSLVTGTYRNATNTINGRLVARHYADETFRGYIIINKDSIPVSGMFEPADK